MHSVSFLRSAVSAALLSVFAASPSLAEKIRFGVTSGPHAEIAEALAPVAKTKGLDIEIVEFSDGALIDPATNDGDLDANGFQHTPYFDQPKIEVSTSLPLVGALCCYRWLVTHASTNLLLNCPRVRKFQSPTIPVMRVAP
ncbi:ABC-type metal ion transport system substrate-binding protein [Ochrobactrum pecoris]|uniref:ABC-type metal ion transport system substrate-binding protein n=1 Tax=Brucella pecoris TaxID=867683 RepID=A0AB34YR05_9HYPH|nr:ABC-type metal ion transport system substrate-binding protein [Brucella pecoris]